MKDVAQGCTMHIAHCTLSWKFSNEQKIFKLWHCDRVLQLCKWRRESSIPPPPLPTQPLQPPLLPSLPPPLPPPPTPSPHPQFFHSNFLKHFLRICQHLPTIRFWQGAGAEDHLQFFIIIFIKFFYHIDRLPYFNWFLFNDINFWKGRNEKNRRCRTHEIIALIQLNKKFVFFSGR